MVDINKKYLTDEDFESLFTEYTNGSKNAFKLIVQKSYVLIDDILKSYVSNEKYDYELLHKICEFALFDAIKTYDPHKSYKNHIKMYILYKIKSFLEKNPNPSISKDNTLIFENINKELKLNITSKDYLDIRAIIELQSSRVKVIIKLRYGYNGNCLPPEEIARKCGYNLDAVINAINNFNNLLTKRYLKVEYKSEEHKELPKEKISLKDSIYEYFSEYTKEEVRYAVGILPLNYRNIIYLKYGNLLSENNNIDTDNNNIIYNEIIGIIESILINFRKNKNKKSLYEYFLEYSKEEVKSAVMHLPKKESRLIYKRFGYDLTSFTFISSDDIEKINSTIIPHIRSLLKDKKSLHQKNIFDYFADYSEEQVIQAISKLGDKQKRIIFSRFGEGLDSSNIIDSYDLKLLEEIIIPRINTILSEKSSLFDINNITKDKLKSALKKLSNEEQVLFYKKFIKKESLTRSELIKLYIEIIPKLKSLINSKTNTCVNKRFKPIYDYFDGFTIEEVNSAISKLDEKYKKILHARYGNTLDEYHQIPSKDRTLIYNVIIPRLRNVLKGKDVKNDRRKLTLLEHFDGYTLEEIKEAISKLNDKDKEIIFKVYGESLDEYHYISKENKNALYTIKRKIQRILNSKKHNKSLFERITDYDESQIRKAISNLAPKHQEVLYKKYGRALNEYYDLTKEENQYLTSVVIPRLKKILKGKALLSTKITELLSASTEEINQIITKLPFEHQTIVYKKYGRFLNEYNKIDKEESTIFYGTILPKMKRMLSKRTIIKYIGDYFDGYNIDEIKNAISKLIASKQEIIYKKFGINLNESNQIPSSEHTIFKRAIKDIRNVLEGIDINQRFQTLIKRLDGYSYEDITKAIGFLEPEKRALFYKKYGTYLDEYHVITKKENSIIENAIVSLKNLLSCNKKSINISLREYFKDYSLEEIKNVISKLKTKEQELLYLKFGENLDECNLINSEKIKSLEKLVIIVGKKLSGELSVKDRKIKYKTIFDHFEGYQAEDIINVINSLNPDEQEIIYKKYGCTLNDYNTLNREETIKLYSIISKMKNILKRKQGKCGRKSQTVYEFLGTDSKETILSLVKNLTDKQQNVFFKKYGHNLDENNTLNSSENSLFYGIVIPNMKRLVNKEPEKHRGPKNKHFSDYFKEYTKEELLSAIALLSIEEQEIIFKRFGKNLDEINTINKNETIKLHNTIISHLRKLLSGEKVQTRKRKTFISYFEGYTIDEIINAISVLDEKYQELIYKKYGHTLDEYNKVSNNENCIISQNIIPKLKLVLNGEFPVRKMKKIWYYFEEYAKEEVINAISKLSNEDQELIHKVFGLDLNEINNYTDTEKTKITRSLFPKIKRLLLNNDHVNSNFIPFFDYFNGYSKEEVLLAIKSLSKKHKDILFKRYGQNLMEQNTASHNEKSIIRQTIIPKLKKVLNRKIIRPSSFYELIGLSREEFLRKIEFLSPEERESLYKYFGYDLDKIEFISKDEDLKTEVENIIIPKIRNMDISKEVFNFDALSPIIESILKEVPNVTKLEIIIFILRIGLEANGPYDMDMISEYFKLSPYDINRITLKVLNEISVNLETIYDYIAKGLSKTEEVKPLMINPIEGDNK